MRRLHRLLGTNSRVLVGNVVARVGALVSLGAATVILARLGGPTEVGIYALLRVLPGLAGVLVSGGLPGAVAYFLVGPRRDDARLRPTIAAMAVVAGAVGSLLWALGSPLLTWPSSARCHWPWWRWQG